MHTIGSGNVREIRRQFETSNLYFGTAVLVLNLRCSATKATEIMISVTLVTFSSFVRRQFLMRTHLYVAGDRNRTGQYSCQYANRMPVDDQYIRRHR